MKVNVLKPHLPGLLTQSAFIWSITNKQEGKSPPLALQPGRSI
jgi:hypothetical protein